MIAYRVLLVRMERAAACRVLGHQLSRTEGTRLGYDHAVCKRCGREL